MSDKWMDALALAEDIASILPHLTTEYGRDEVETAVESWLNEGSDAGESLEELASRFDHVSHRYLS